MVLERDFSVVAEDALGVSAREIDYRPHRYSADDLAPLRAFVSICPVPEGAEYRFPIRNVSQGGAAFFVDDELELTATQELHRVRVVFDHHEAYVGAGRVTSVREEGGRLSCGIELLDGLLNMESVCGLREQKVAQEVAVRNAVELHNAWSGPERLEFKARVAEFRLFLDGVRRQLDDLEGALPWGTLTSEESAPARTALVELLRQELVRPFGTFTANLNSAMLAVEPSEHHAMREFARGLLHKPLLSAPLIRRAYEKPLGYAGDHVVMSYIYGDEFAGDSLFASYVHLAAWSQPVCAAVRARAQFVGRQIAGRLASWQEGDRTPRILAIAAGPAEEIHALLRAAEPHWPPFEVVLFDQDRAALDVCYRRLRRAAFEHGCEGVRVRFVHDSIRRLLRDLTLLAGLGDFEIVFSSGLCDYLDLGSAQALALKLYGVLAPGGTAYVGNLGPRNPCRFVMEYLADWYLQYRDRDELLAVGAALPVEAACRVQSGPSGIERYLIAEKPNG